MNLKEVDYAGWEKGLRDGKLCFQSGNSKAVYTMDDNGDVYYNGKIHAENHFVHKWINGLNDEFRKFYVLEAD